MSQSINNLYDVLEIPAFSDIAKVKEAYRRLALAYHPDRNPDNQQAEEYFKRIALAYQILSHPEKKWTYDQQLREQIRMASEQQVAEGSYQSRWKQSKDSLVDIKIGLVLVLLVLAGIWVFTYQSGSRRRESERERKRRFELYFAKSKQLFDNHKFGQALTELRAHSFEHDTTPYAFELKMEYRELEEFYHDELERMGKEYEQKNQYDSAAECFAVLSDFFLDEREKWLFREVTTYRRARQPQKAIELLEQFDQLGKKPYTRYVIAQIIHIDMQNPSSALRHYDEAISRIITEYTNQHGRAYVVVLQPEKVPDFHYDVSLGRALARMQSGLTRQAIEDCKWCMFLRPQKPEAFLVRANLLAAAGKYSAACEDFEKGKSAATPQEAERFNEICGR